MIFLVGTDICKPTSNILLDLIILLISKVYERCNAALLHNGELILHVFAEVGRVPALHEQIFVE